MLAGVGMVVGEDGKQIIFALASELVIMNASMTIVRCFKNGIYIPGC